MRRGILIAAVSLLGRSATAQLPPVIIRDAGPGPVGGYLAATLARPDTRVLMADTVEIPRDSSFAGSVVIIGKLAAVRGQVGGDLIVVGGDLFIKPGARVMGQAVAIGGGAYASLLAIVRGGVVSHRDFTFDAERTAASIDLRYREQYVTAGTRMVTLPGVFGLRIPRYDRSNGLSLGIGPRATLPGAVTLDVVATYRAQLGAFDPVVTAEWKPSRRFWLTGFAGRESRSNDTWITGTVANSISALFTGADTRNWYRASAVDLIANRLFETATTASTYRLGGQIERAASMRPDSFPTGGPWSFFGRKSSKGMRRPNPQVPDGTIGSVVGGAAYRWTAGDLRARLDVGVEVPVSTTRRERFVQSTIDGQIRFPTFRDQRYGLEVHAILTPGDTAPPQRFGYVGGNGTISTEDLLVLGGDQLVFLESRYEIPLTAVRLPFVGSPTLMLRHMMGTAGIQRLPNLTQNVGLRLSVPFVRIQGVMDVATKKVEVGASLSLTR